MIPGLCEGDAATLTERLGVPVEKGPKDLREIPQHFGRAARAADYGAWQIEILAEINNAPRMDRASLRALAEYYRASGADVIDIGCTPGRPYPELASVVHELAGRRAPGQRRLVRPRRDHDGARCRRRDGAERQRHEHRRRRALCRERQAIRRDSRRRRPVRRTGAQPRAPRALAGEVPHRPHHRTDRLRLHGVTRALRRGAPSLAHGAADDGHREHHRTHGRGHDRHECAAHRDLRGSGRARGADHRGHPLGPRMPCARSTSRAG